VTGTSFDIADRGGAAERAIATRLGAFERVLVLARGPSAADTALRPDAFDGVLVTDPTYATGDVFRGEPAAVLIGDFCDRLPRVAERWLATPPGGRPLLMFGYIPRALRTHHPDFAALGLPPPQPILPLLVRRGLYAGGDPEVYPTTGVFLTLLAAAVCRRVTVAGVDLYRHPTGRMYHAPPPGQPHVAWPDRHSEACDTEHLRRAAALRGSGLKLLGVAGEAVRAMSEDHDQS
jgi:hypothetical protein